MRTRLIPSKTLHLKNTQSRIKISKTIREVERYWLCTNFVSHFVDYYMETYNFILSIQCILINLSLHVKIS